MPKATANQSDLPPTDRPPKKARVSPETLVQTANEDIAQDPVPPEDMIQDDLEEDPYGEVSRLSGEPTHASDMYLDTVCPVNFSFFL